MNVRGSGVLAYLALLSQLLTQFGAVFGGQPAHIVVGRTRGLLCLQRSAQVGPSALRIHLGRTGWCCQGLMAARRLLLTCSGERDLATEDQQYRVGEV